MDLDCGLRVFGFGRLRSGHRESMLQAFIAIIRKRSVSMKVLP